MSHIFATLIPKIHCWAREIAEEGKLRARRIVVRQPFGVGEIRRVLDLTIWFERDCDEEIRLLIVR